VAKDDEDEVEEDGLAFDDVGEGKIAAAAASNVSGDYSIASDACGPRPAKRSRTHEDAVAGCDEGAEYGSSCEEEAEKEGLGMQASCAIALAGHEVQQPPGMQPPGMQQQEQLVDAAGSGYNGSGGEAGEEIAVAEDNAEEMLANDGLWAQGSGVYIGTGMELELHHAEPEGNDELSEAKEGEEGEEEKEQLGGGEEEEGERDAGLLASGRGSSSREAKRLAAACSNVRGHFLPPTSARRPGSLRR